MEKNKNQSDFIEEGKSIQGTLEGHPACQKIFELLPVIVIATNNAGYIHFVSPKIYDWLGYRAEEIMGKHFSELICLSEKNKRLIEDKILEGRRSKESVYYEIVLKSLSGDIIYCAVQSAPLLDSKGSHIGAIAVFSNITKLKQVQRGLQEKSAAIEYSIDAMAIADLNRNLKYINPAFLQMWGYEDVNEVLGRSAIDFWKSKERASAIVRSIMRDGGWSGELVAQRKDGTLFDVKVSTSLIKRENGEPLSVMASFMDITEQKRLDIAKSEFIATASHQLRNPLASINWYAEMLSAIPDSSKNKKVKRYSTEIHNSTIRLISLVNALLNTSRIELGTFSTSVRRFDLVELIEDILKIFSSQIKNKRIAVSKNFSKISFYIKSDSMQLRIILQNLMSNAVKYSNKNGSLKISLEEKGEEILFKIFNTGYGIPKAQQSRIFTKFFRASNILDKEKDGTGLGLYIAKSLIDNLKGKIRLESEEDKGATFFLALPNNLDKEIKGTGELIIN